MRATYEAVLNNDRIEWTGRHPDSGRHRILVTVLDPPARSPEDVQRVLDQTRGAWATGKSIEEIDAQIEAMRAEWDRPWDDPNWKPEQ